jgi:hypothetical protein
MANSKPNRVRQNVSSAPLLTTTIPLGTAVTKFRTYAQAGVVDGQPVNYVAEDGNNWQYGRGTYSAAGPSLINITVSGSSAGGTTPNNLSSSTIISCDAFSEDFDEIDFTSQLADPSGDIAEVEAATKAMRVVRYPAREVNDHYRIHSYAAAFSWNTTQAASTAVNANIAVMAWQWQGICQIKTIRVWFGQSAITGARGAGGAGIKLFMNRYTDTEGSGNRVNPVGGTTGSRGKGLTGSICTRYPSPLLIFNTNTLIDLPNTWYELQGLSAGYMHAPGGVENVLQGAYLWDHLVDGGPVTLETMMNAYVTLDYPSAATSDAPMGSVQITWDEIVPTFWTN